MKRRMSGSFFATIAGLALILGLAINTTESRAQTPEAEITQVVSNLVTAWNDQNAETFIGYFTDNGLEAAFDVTRDEASAAIAQEMEGIGPITDHSVSDISATSESGTAAVEIEFEVGFVLFEEWSFVFTNGEWLIDDNRPLFRQIPAGVPAVQMDLDEYAFIYDQNAVASGNFAFQVRNVGEEEHEIVLVRITADGALLDILAAAGDEEDIPEGIDLVGFGGFYPVGTTEGTAVFPTPLNAGRYGLVCFIPAPDGTPHAFLGMVSEFTVGAGAAPGQGDPVAPPSSGDAGLAGGQSNGMLGIAIIGALMLLAGIAGVAKAHPRQ